MCRMVNGVNHADQAHQRLHNIVRKDVPFNTKAREALTLAQQYLNVDSAYLAQIDRETDHWEIVVTADTEDGQPSPGLELELQETYCRETIETDSAFALHDASEQGWEDDQALEISGQHAYLGIPLITEKGPYGTVCFTAQAPRPEPFSEAEIRFAEHLTRLLEREVEKELIDGELTNQTNLAAVLHRVLRHNLRNDISIIRGYTELMAEQLDDDSVSQTALSHIDDLIDLSQKARELEEIITTSPERQVTRIGALVDEICEEITQKYPAASVTVEYENEIQARVLQNFDRAIEELVENAVKHSGDTPRVTVAIETVPNGIEIRIEDNGPGLPDHEAEVLTSGEETPLAHGTGLGLWLAYWIVSSHDGSIHPKTTERGTILTVTIPRGPAVNTKQLTKLTRSRDKYKASFEEASDAIVITNDDGRIIDANAAAATIFGTGGDELLGQSLTELLSNGFAFDTKWYDFLETGDTRATTTVTGVDGVERTVEYTGTSDIVPGQHLLIGRDVTEQKERERTLMELKQRYESLLEAAPDPLLVADPETGEIRELNEAAEALLGMPSDEIVGMHQSEIHPAEQADLYQQTFGQHVESDGVKRQLPDGSQLTVVTANGDRIPVEISATTVSLPDGPVTYATFRDVSEQVERERALEATTQRLQLALEGTDSGVWEWHIGTDEVRWSESLERLVGIAPGTFEGTFDAFGEYIHPDDRQNVVAAVERAAETESRFQTEYRLQCEDGTQIWVESRGKVYREANETGRMIGIVTDITERKEREAELIQKTEAMEKAPIGITLSDPDQRDNPLVYANQRFCELTGYEESDILGRNCRFMQGPETDPESVAEIRDAIDNGEPVSTVLRNYRDDGTTFWNRVTIAPIGGEDGSISNSVGFQEDVTERKEREQQLKLAEAVFENTQDALFVVDVTENGEFCIERVNQIYEDLTGLSNSKIAGQTPTEAVGEEIGSKIESQYRECVERQETIEYREEISVDGEQRQWETKLTPVVTEGRVDRLVGAMRDVTAV